jgi:hypothetical protein
MSARQDDKSFQRMMQGAAGSSARPPADCPEPEILAAYCEQSLEAAEQARWEEHFSNCLRCQLQLAALVRSAPAPAETFPGVASDKPEEKSWLAWLTQWHYAWRWLVPVGALAVVLALWVSVRQPSPSMDRLVALKKEVAVARATPPNPAAANTEELKSSARNAPALPPPSVSKKSAVASAHTKGHIKGPFLEKKVEPFSATPARPSVAVAPAVIEEKGNKPAASDQLAIAEAAPKSAEAQPSPESTPLRVLSNAPQPRAKVTGGNLVAQGAINGRSGLALMATDQSNWVLVPVAGTKTLWRIGPAGAIERSIDLGLTWQGQFADEKVSLLAGWAPSGQVCWVVGRRGTVLRTTDGQHWEKVTSPAAVDLISVTAKNAQKATVTAADQRKFKTTDGGQSWEAAKK